MYKIIFALLITTLVMIMADISGYSHDTGHEARTAAQCEKLKGTDTEGDRATCLKCISRPVKHHYHPDMPPGQRCRPDNGKP